jgi:hypothetical protein
MPIRKRMRESTQLKDSTFIPGGEGFMNTFKALNRGPNYLLTACRKALIRGWKFNFEEGRF